MKIKEAQNKIKGFDIARGWDNNWNLKDLSLNITEEVGEFWGLIKWIDDEKQKEVIENKKEEASDFIGDTLFLLLKLSNQMNIDASQALQNTLDEYEKRMPPEVMRKVGHANKLAGGHDNKNFNLEENKD
ncbi:MAG: MazG nucleotide pyrophosphohydrolase domain-containing protein [Candidatus Spechtbacterales bacterium]